MKKSIYTLFFATIATMAMAVVPPRVQPGQQPTEEQLARYNAMRAEMDAVPQEQAAGAPARVAGVGTRSLFSRVPVIMVNFANKSFTITREHADSLFNARTPLIANTSIGDIPYGSVAQYFDDQSLGQYRPEFDVYGPYDLSKNYSSYGSTNSATRAMISEACTLADGDIDFSQYDSDNDGYIDLVFVLYAGYGENDAVGLDGILSESEITNLVWPHFWNVGSSTTYRYDGKRLYNYECSNEIDGFEDIPAGIGVLVHEFSHGMGLPDIYGTGGNNSGVQYMGAWSLMDYGCYNGGTYIPTSYTGYERWFMGWQSPIALNTQRNVTLDAISKTGQFGVLTTNGTMPTKANSGEYWVVENRQYDGWDGQQYGEGLLCYKVKYHNYWGNGANYGTANIGMQLLPADGTLRDNYGAIGKQGDCYPYNNQNITVAANYPITAITQNANGTISFRVAGGYDSYGVTVEQSVEGLAVVEAEPAPSGLYLYDATYGYGATITVNDGYAMDSIVITTSTGTTLVEDEDYLYEDGYLYILSVTDELTIHLMGQSTTATGLTQTQTQTQTQKVLINGTLYILKEGKWYDVMGRHVER